YGVHETVISPLRIPRGLCGFLASRSRPHEPARKFCGRIRIQRNDSRKLLMRLLKSSSFFRSSSTFLIEWMTVEWCFPPKLRPISGNDACVSDLHMYIATWRGMAMDFELLRDFSSAIFNW